MGPAQSRSVSAAAAAANWQSVPAGHFFVPATDQRIRCCGRVAADAAQGTVTFDWPATSLTWAAAAERVWLRMDGGRNYFNIVVDGQAVEVLETRQGVRDYLIQAGSSSGLASASADGSSSGVHSRTRTFEVQKRTEASIATLFGSLLGRGTKVVVVYGVVSEDGAVLQDAPMRLDQPRLEFLGDSDTTGFGNLGPSQPGTITLRSLLTMSPAQQDVFQSWPALTSRALGAEFHVIAWSGLGVLWNSEPGCTADGTFKDVYARVLATCSSSAADSTTLSSWVPDVVVIYLGGNDWYTLVAKRRARATGGGGGGAGEDSELAAACHRLLAQLRQLRPEADLLVLFPSADSAGSCLGSLAEQELFAEDMEKCWSQAASLAQDGQVFLERVCPCPKIELTCREDWGQMAHWSAQGHQKWAQAVAPLVAKRLRGRGGSWRTVKAKEYPPSLCRAIARAMVLVVDEAVGKRPANSAAIGADLRIDGKDANEEKTGEDRVRPVKWWKVSDERLQELVLELSSSPKAIPGLSSSSSAPCLGTSKDSNDRQSAAERSIQQRMASLRTSTDEISIHIFFVDTGDIMTLRVAPDLRIGPPKPPAKNRFTEVYGLGACTKGFSDVRNFDYKRREFDATKRANWSPPWTESLKGLIQHFAGAHASRQKIIIKNVPTSSDDLTLRSWGVIDGETLQLRIEKKGAEPGETQHGSATASSTLLTGSISLRNSRHLKECKADGDVWMMPRWISQAHPNVLKRAAWDVPGKQGSPMAVFSDGPIWMADADNHALMSVRTKVAGHAGYQNLGR
ncbi:unnamed protein product [Polarella glacialis]|uniref:SGNH hydrolase-type esterase domain-containing protein n=1 Tax=Polarella glacialis TaxID=89957 RepID=A0A813KRX8_POLGL|nr:unnamed protein product [Polarella glacialis]